MILTLTIEPGIKLNSYKIPPARYKSCSNFLWSYLICEINVLYFRSFKCSEDGKSCDRKLKKFIKKIVPNAPKCDFVDPQRRFDFKKNSLNLASSQNWKIASCSTYL